MGSSTGESGLVDGKVVVVMAARRAWEASPLFFSTSSRWYQEVCEVPFVFFRIEFLLFLGLLLY